jgi:hypothetical protein
MPTTTMGVALVVKVRRNDTPVITDTDDAHDRVEWQASLVATLGDPNGTLVVDAEGVRLLFPVRSIESIGLLDGDEATRWRTQMRMRR